LCYEGERLKKTALMGHRVSVFPVVES
jgi:hypothetical protein